MDIKTILVELGYNLTDDKDSWRSNSLYRGGSNSTALRIFKNGTGYIDFVTNTKGTLEDLIQLTLGLKDINSAKKWLENKNFTISEIKHEKPTLKMTKIYPPEILQELLPNHDYWLNRGIALETIKLFKGGLASKGRLKNRQVLPIFNGKKEIIGFIGRSIDDQQIPKYKILGPKSEFVWPAFLNLNIIKEKSEVILVESPYCVMKMWDSGIKNVLCLFGTEISIKLLNFLLKIDSNHIIISTNNEESLVGNEAAKKLHKKLCKFFDEIQVRIVLPTKKDFGEMTKIEIMEWYPKPK